MLTGTCTQYDSYSFNNACLIFHKRALTLTCSISRSLCLAHYLINSYLILNQRSCLMKQRRVTALKGLTGNTVTQIQ